MTQAGLDQTKQDQKSSESTNKGCSRKLWEAFSEKSAFIADNNQLEAMKNISLDWLQDIFDQGEPYSISMFGNSGIGKTMIMNELLQFLKLHNAIKKPGEYTGYHYLNVKMIRGYEYAGLKFSGKANEFMNADVLLIDEIDRVRNDGKGMMQEMIFEMLDLRQRKWTLYTSNKSLNWFEGLDYAIADRFKRNGSKCLELNMKSYTERKKE